MSKALEQFESMYEIINEVISPVPPASGAIAATNDSPRKDFGPSSAAGYPPNTKNSLIDPYQTHPSSTMPDPDRPPHLPYPMDTINDFLSQSYVYLDAALSQMKAVHSTNPTINPAVKAELKRLLEISKKAKKAIKYVGLNLTKAVNLNY